jgi:hypothetical protein
MTNQSTPELPKNPPQLPKNPPQLAMPDAFVHPSPGMPLPGAFVHPSPGMPVPGVPGGAGPVGPPLVAATASKPARKHRWVWPVAATSAFIIGIGIGGAGADGDPTASKEYRAVVAQRDELRGTADAASARADAAESAAKTKSTELDSRSADLDTRKAELDATKAQLDAREAALTATEAKVAASQIDNGTWTVGVDIELGSYRTVEAITSACYWAILRTGSNGDDIIQNDIVEGGFPSVTLKAGQDFKNSCGVWNKQ